MKNNYFLLTLSVVSVQSTIVTAMDAPSQTVQLYKGMEKGPMNSDWFYPGIPPHDKANQFHQNRQWGEAAIEYERVKDKFLPCYAKEGDYYFITPKEVEYTRNMARLNLAACLMAQRKSSEHWASFDVLLGIPENKRIFGKMEQLRDKLVLIKTDKVGIGDIFCFFEAAHILKKRTGCYVIFSVRDFLKNTLLSIATAYDFGLIRESDEQLKTDYETHIIGLLGHLQLYPAETAPERVILTAPERAMVAVAQQIDPVLAQGKTMAMVHIGENRQATLIGGKQLPRDIKNHGRHLDSEPFSLLLKNYKDLVLLDCGGENSSVTVDDGQKNRYMKIAPEGQAFDTLIALALLMNDRQKMIGFGADNGPANVFIRALTKTAQRRMALIIPNGSLYTGECDMRMEGDGLTYTHMLSNCRVYKCDTPQDQNMVIDNAYQDMIGQESPIHHYIQ